MSVSFEKHREKIIAAWKDVLDDKSTTDWALFGYEGQTNELKLVGSGEGGLDELCEDLNSGKMMYAFVRIEDPKTSLTKYLLINWQGEGAPVLRKGTCANHIHDIAKLLTGAHLTINARVEDDIDKERILKKLSTVSSAYSFKEPRTIQDEPKGPIGTNYTRVIPAKEINPTEMQNFWKKEEEEERHRIEMEQERKKLELLKREEELRAREEKEHREREKKIAESGKIESSHVPIKTSPQPLSPVKNLGSPTRVVTEAERMRLLRSQEARELIGSRVGDAKAIFTQNTSDGQMQSRSAPIKPVRNSIAQRINALNNAQQQPHQHQHQQQQPQPQPQQQQLEEEEDKTVQENLSSTVISSQLPPSSLEQSTLSATAIATAATAIAPPSTATTTVNIIEQQSTIPEIVAEATEENYNQQNANDFIENDEQYSTIKRSPHSKTNSLASPDESNPTPKIGENQQSTNNGTNGQQYIGSNNQNDVVTVDDIIYQDILSDGGLKARALYDYQAADDSEITFDPGDIITHIDQIDEGWWQGLGPDGTYGLFPANYVELIN